MSAIPYFVPAPILLSRAITGFSRCPSIASRCPLKKKYILPVIFEKSTKSQILGLPCRDPIADNAIKTIRNRFIFSLNRPNLGRYGPYCSLLHFRFIYTVENRDLLSVADSFYPYLLQSRQYYVKIIMMSEVFFMPHADYRERPKLGNLLSIYIKQNVIYSYRSILMERANNVGCFLR